MDTNEQGDGEQGETIIGRTAWVLRDGMLIELTFDEDGELVKRTAHPWPADVPFSGPRGQGPWANLPKRPL